MAGKVFVGDKLCDKPGTLVDSKVSVAMKKEENPYVSRGGLKLEGAFADLPSLKVEGLAVLDAGVSTGGFTDYLLKMGAAKIFAVDVGYGQLDYRLRQDPRVVVMERCNVRYLQPDDLPETPGLAVIDLSFISLKLIIPVMKTLDIPLLLALVKPQFEAGRAEAARGEGVIKDPSIHQRVLNDLIAFSAKKGYNLLGLTYSRWPGPKGNMEFFILLGLEADPVTEETVNRIVVEAVSGAHSLNG